MTETSGTHLLDLIPENIDDIIRVNRDRFQLAFATDAELEGLEQAIPGPSASVVRHSSQDWNILLVHQTIDGSRKSLPVLLGKVLETGECRVTSAVTAIDSRAGLVRTAHSLYRIVGPRNPTPDRHLLMHICIWLNQRGVGPYYGVPKFFY